MSCQERTAASSSSALGEDEDDYDEEDHRRECLEDAEEEKEHDGSKEGEKSGVGEEAAEPKGDEKVANNNMSETKRVEPEKGSHTGEVTTHPSSTPVVSTGEVEGQPVSNASAGGDGVPTSSGTPGAMPPPPKPKSTLSQVTSGTDGHMCLLVGQLSYNILSFAVFFSGMHMFVNMWNVVHVAMDLRGLYTCIQPRE